jgi:nucleoside-diphosphate-sugar epimerase
MPSVLITGAGGNLGRKLTGHLLATAWSGEVVALDHAKGNPNRATGERVRHVHADLSDPKDARWRDALRDVESVVHFAARNPNPDASWSDAAASFDMTLHIVQVAAEAGVKRFVFASSNHVMGRYKDAPLADEVSEPGSLRTVLAPGPGTRWFNGSETVDGTAYATSKLMGERLCIAQAVLSGGAFTTVSVRIGWCQPGENDPGTINSTGVAGGQTPEGPDSARDLLWFRQMWLSNEDFLGIMEHALTADAARWPGPGIVVNGMSANTGMPWDLEGTREFLGYSPKDDVWRRLESGRDASG